MFHPIDTVAVQAGPGPVFAVPPAHLVLAGGPPSNAGWVAFVILHFFSFGGIEYHSFSGGHGTLNPL